MLRKVSILGLVIVLLISVMSGCISTGYLNEESSVIEEQTTTTPAPTTTPVNKDAISAQLAQLTNEDGTGVISFGMSNEEIAEKMDEYNIPYEIRPSGSILAADGSYYVGGGNGYFQVMQTKLGLEIGDTLLKVVELYGQPDEKIDGDNCYIYKSGRKIYQDDIILQIQMYGERVNMIFIKVDEKVYGGAE